MTFDEFAAEVLRRVRAEMPTLTGPEDDIEPALFHYFEGGALRKMDLPQAWFSDRESKNRGIASIAAATRAMNPDFIAIEVTAYYAEYDFSTLTAEERRRATEDLVQPARLPMPSKAPHRRECVQVIALDHSKSEGWFSFIERDGRRPPVYGEWEPMGMVPDGAIVRPLQQAMQATSRAAPARR
jgi:hypothetical protein